MTPFSVNLLTTVQDRTVHVYLISTESNSFCGNVTILVTAVLVELSVNVIVVMLNKCVFVILVEVNRNRFYVIVKLATFTLYLISAD